MGSRAKLFELAERAEKIFNRPKIWQQLNALAEMELFPGIVGTDIDISQVPEDQIELIENALQDLLDSRWGE